jgi:iron complex outermembrane receptor protein
MNNPNIRRAVRLALAGGAAAGAVCTPAMAQDQEQTDDEAISTVVVTGSRISSPNLEAISPVTAITSEDIGLTGKVRVEDIINQLPQAFAAQGSNISNAADGTASVNLRGLGVNRTLTLVNGRRLMPGDPDGGSAADLNQIPLALVKRVDVLTGGASSVYGADAVAGVVNFVMDTEFEGLRIDANYNWNQHENDNTATQNIINASGYALPESSVDNGYAKDITLALGVGAPGDRGHATFYAGYREVDAVLQAEYDYSACTFNSSNPTLPADQQVFTCGGSPTTAPARFQPINTATGSLPANEILGENGELRPFTPADQYNFGPLNYYQRPDERYTAGAFISFDVSEKAQAYGEMMFMDDRSVAQIAPSGAFSATPTINCDNPFLAQSMIDSWCTRFGLSGADETTILVGRRNIEGGGRQDDLGHESYRAIAGFRGELSTSWSYDAYFQHGRTKRNSTYGNDFSNTRLGRAMDVRIDTRPGLATTGTPQCESFIDGSDPLCVPWNIFQNDQVSPEALAYLQTPGFIRAEAEQQISHADFTGDLTNWIKLPSAETGLVVNLGAEYRDESTEFRPDTAFTTGDLAGQGGATNATLGGYNAKDAFMEARLPLVEGRTGIQSLSVEAGYRYSEYSTGFDTDTYKYGLDWAPIESLRFRGSFQHAVRAPNVGELFATQSVALDGTTDPCDGQAGDGLSNGPTATLEQCMLTGMTAAQYGNVPENSAAQYNGLLGGNPVLTPETSDTVSFGFVWRPSFANLTVAIDYFDIDVEDTISSVNGGNADVYINSCLAGQASFCSLIQRDQFGSLWILPTGFITDTSLNLGGLTTQGYDIQASYGLDIGEHRLGFNLVGTLLEDLSTAPLPDGDFYDCAGLYGGICGVPAPEWRHALRTTWSTPWAGLDVSATWRYFSSVDLDKTSSDSQLSAPVALTDASFDAVDYIDLTAAITFADNYTFRVGANNVLDEAPPLVGQANCPAGICSGNTFSQVYDTLGRQVFMSLTVDF